MVYICSGGTLLRIKIINLYNINHHINVTNVKRSRLLSFLLTLTDYVMQH